MSLVVTLVCNPARPVLTPGLAERAREVAGARDIVWLGENVACDLLAPEGMAAAEVDAAMKREFAAEPLDIAVQEAAGRKKKLLLADMDSTMIEQECIDELADEIGIKRRVAEITARAMNGEIAFEPALRERVALLAGLEMAVIERVIENRITFAPGGHELVATMNAAGAWTALVSGGFDLFTGRVAERLGFREHRANRLVERGGRLAGEVVEPILGRAAKAAALLEICARLGIAPAEVIAVGDGANDLDMLALAGTGVAVHAKPAVAARAGFRIDHGDLTALLYLQGYSQSEFAR